MSFLCLAMDDGVDEEGNETPMSDERKEEGQRSNKSVVKGSVRRMDSSTVMPRPQSLPNNREEGHLSKTSR